MAIEFLAIAFIMSMIAITFVGFPLIRRTPSSSSGFARVPGLFVIAAIVLAIVLYALIGHPDAIDTGRDVLTVAESRRPGTTSRDDGKTGSVASLLGGLEERLQQDPDNGKDWLLLAKSYDHVGEPVKALDAYRRAARLGNVDTQLEAKLVGHALEATVRNDVQIRGSVLLSQDATELVQSDDTVFILVRESGGSPMPLAVQKFTVADFPINFSMSDKNSMVAGRGISAAQTVVVEARVSATGDAHSTKSGLVASSTSFSPADPAPVNLVLEPASGVDSK